MGPAVRTAFLLNLPACSLTRSVAVVAPWLCGYTGRWLLNWMKSLTPDRLSRSLFQNEFSLLLGLIHVVTLGRSPWTDGPDQRDPSGNENV